MHLNDQLNRCVCYYNISLLSLYTNGYVLVASTCHLLRKTSVEKKIKPKNKVTVAWFTISRLLRGIQFNRETEQLAVCARCLVDSNISSSCWRLFGGPKRRQEELQVSHYRTLVTDRVCRCLSSLLYGVQLGRTIRRGF